MSKTNQQDVTTSFLRSVQTGTYPETDDVASSELSVEFLPSILEALKQARTEVQNDISRISRKEAPNVDGWVQQARQLQIDIEHSKSVAREIVKESQELDSVRESRKDVSTKAELLKIEVEFNERLRDTLEHIQHTADKLSAGQGAVTNRELVAAQAQYEVASTALTELRPFEDTLLVDLLQQRLDKLRGSLVDELSHTWHGFVQVDSNHSRISIQAPESSSPDFESTADLMMRLDVFDAKLVTFVRDLDRLILKPRLHRFADNTVTRLVIGGQEVHLGKRDTDPGAVSLLDDLTELLKFLRAKLPSAMSAYLSEMLMPNLISSIISSWLSTSVSASLDALPDYDKLLERVKLFASEITEMGWQGGSDLSEWVDDAPKVWLAKRREASLMSVREAITHGIRKTKVVERVETQMVAKDDVIVSQAESGDDWDTAWAETETERPAESVSASGEDEDLSAWDDPAEESLESPPQADLLESTEADEVDDAWAWDEKDTETSSPATLEPKRSGTQVNGHPQNKDTQRELTLKETYTVTTVPEQLLDIITEIIADGQKLDTPLFTDSPVAAAAIGLFSIPKLALAGFRALAPTYYSVVEGGNMYLYNDCIRLASELTELISRQSSLDATSSARKAAWPSTRMKLESDVDALSSFGKRAYGKEMESQRTILIDLLDGAQGFANSTEAPFAAECDNAISMASDRIREVRKQWIPILSRSALLQSMGSLLATVLNKVIVDICDLSDISEAESARLKHFCDELTNLSELFTQENPHSDNTDMTGIYTPNWFKFQYLSEIMESSLADIKYLWNEGELKLEFEASEVIDLVEALFAESDYRRRAIADIRRG